MPSPLTVTTSVTKKQQHWSSSYHHRTGSSSSSKWVLYQHINSNSRCVRLLHITGLSHTHLLLLMQQTAEEVTWQQPHVQQHQQQQQVVPARQRRPGTVRLWAQKTAGYTPGRCLQAIHSSTTAQWAAAVQGGHRLAGHRLRRPMIAGWAIQQQQQQAGSRGAARHLLLLVCMWG
jgi:hypothetical protein